MLAAGDFGRQVEISDGQSKALQTKYPSILFEFRIEKKEEQDLTQCFCGTN